MAERSCCEVRTSEYHCGACHHTFGTLGLFDAHQDTAYNRPQPVVCREPQALGAVRDTRGTWQTPEGFRSRAQSAERMAERRRQAASA